MRSETSYASGMDPLHASIEDFTAEGFTHIECHCPRCRMTRWGRSVGFHESRWDLPLHSYQHGSAEPSAAGSFTPVKPWRLEDVLGKPLGRRE